ncbi:MAG: hypothetical protein L3J03_05405 [Desulfobacterales bacterium]|nr:hypothetical protein [Desulfobacterales bacterium]
MTSNGAEMAGSVGRSRKDAQKREPEPFKRSGLDRRSGDDRRRAYHVDYFDQGGVERRCGERRNPEEKRDGWIRVGKWVGICIGPHCLAAGRKKSAARQFPGQGHGMLGAPPLERSISGIIERQLEENDPAIVGRTIRRLCRDGMARSEAMHAVGLTYAMLVFQGMEENRPFDIAEYVVRLGSMPSLACRPAATDLGAGDSAMTSFPNP